MNNRLAILLMVPLITACAAAPGLGAATPTPAVAVASTPTPAVAVASTPAPTTPPPPPALVSSVPEASSSALSFAGHEWLLEVSPPGESPPTTVGGFSGRHAWVDGGNLHLRLEPIDDVWQGASVVSERQGWGYGTYQWTIDSRIDGFHPSTVVGLFTYEAGAPGNREIDIEIGRFGDGGKPQNMVVGRYDDNGLVARTWRIGDEAPTVHAFTWQPGWVQWVTRDEATGEILHSSGAPTPVIPGNERVHMNLWVCCNSAPDRPQHVVISDFTFIPFEG